jgi:protein-S-isoprenylcysteine O-methyltransferase Ste14
MTRWIPEPLDLYRLLLIVLMCVLSFLRTYYKIKARAFRRPDYRQEGIINVILRYLFGLPLFAAVFLYILYPTVFPWMYLPVPVWLRITGFILGLLSLSLLAWAHHELGMNFSMTVLIQKKQQLVTSGVYHWLRHPIYMAYLVLFFAISLLSGCWMIGLAGEAVIYTLINGRLKIEEHLLQERFGEAYLRYASATGKFFPRISISGHFKNIRKIHLSFSKKEEQNVGDQ